MKKRAILIGIAGLSLILAGCSGPDIGSAAAQSNQDAASYSSSVSENEQPPVLSEDSSKNPEIEEGSAEITVNIESEPPLSVSDLSISVPDFLDDDQQLLYRKAHSLYQHMFGGSTGGIDYFETLDTVPPDPPMVEIDGRIYNISAGRYRNWVDFEAVIQSVFTDSFAEQTGLYSIYRSYNGRLAYLLAERGAGYYYNENFPDEFRLITQSDSEISFVLIGHYSPVFLKEGETAEERDARLASEYEYTLEFPISLVNTDLGWRFSQFHSALADEDVPQDATSQLQN